MLLNIFYPTKPLGLKDQCQRLGTSLGIRLYCGYEVAERWVAATYSEQHLALPGAMVGKRLRELTALAEHDSAEKTKKKMSIPVQ